MFVKDVIVRRVTHTCQTAASAVRDAAARKPAASYPASVVSTCVAELRDLFILSGWECGRAEPSGGASDDCWVVQDGRWGEVMRWAVAHCRTSPPLSGQPASGSFRVVGETPAGVALSLGPHTAWMDDAVVCGIYSAVWQLKRFVASLFTFPAVPVRVLLLRSGSRDGGEDNIDKDDNISRMTSVAVVPAADGTAVDVRVWQTVLAVSGQRRSLDAVVQLVESRWERRAGERSTRDASAAGVVAAGERGGQLLKKRRLMPGSDGSGGAEDAEGGGNKDESTAGGAGGRLPVPFPDDFLLRAVLGVHSPADGAAGSLGSSALADLSAFEHILSVSHLVALVQFMRRGSKASEARPRDEPGGGRRGRVAGGLPDGLWMYASLVRDIVHDVIGGWDAMARGVGFPSVETMLAPYIIWYGATCSFSGLGRPLDVSAFAPRRQEYDLFHWLGPCTRESIGDARPCERALARLPLADEQLRQCAMQLLRHLSHCTSAECLEALYRHERQQRQHGQGRTDVAVGAGSAAAAAPSSTGVEQRLGALSVLSFRPPLWSREPGSVPRVLRTVRRGLTALVRGEARSLSTAAAESSSNGSSSSRLSRCRELDQRDSARSGRRAKGPAGGGQYATGGAGRMPDSLRSSSSLAVSPPLPYAEATRVVQSVLDSVVRLHSCSFRQLLSVHAASFPHPSGAGSARDGGGGSVRAGPARRPPRTGLGLPSDLSGVVQLVLTDPPYNVRRLARKEQSDHDVLSEADMRACVDLFLRLVRPGGHLLIFSSAEQHPLWVSLLRLATDRPLGRPQHQRRGVGTGRAAFRVDTSPLFIIKDAHSFTTQRRSSTNLSPKVEYVVHATRAGAEARDAYEMVNYRAFNSVPSRFPAHHNVIDNVRPPLYHEVVRRGGSGAGAGKWLRPEQKSLALLEELIQRFSQPGDIVVDPFAGTFSTAVACLRVPLGQYRLAVCCDTDAEVIGPGVARVRREMVDQLAIGGFADVCGVGRREVGHAASLAARVVHAAAADDGAGGGGLGAGAWGETIKPRGEAPRTSADDSTSGSSTSGGAASAGDAARGGGGCESSRAGGGAAARAPSFAHAPPTPAVDDDWVPPVGFPCHSALPVPVLRFLATRWAADADEQRAGRHSHPRAPPPGRDVAKAVLRLEGVGVGDWPSPMRAALAVEDMTVLRAHSAASLGLYLARSELAGGTAGLGIFAGRAFVKGEELAPFFGAIVHSDLGIKGSQTARYASAVLGSHGPSARHFKERALEVYVRPPSASTSGGPATGRPAASAAGWRPKHRRLLTDGGVPVWIVPSPLCVAGYVNDRRPTGVVDEAASEAALLSARSARADVGVRSASDGASGGAPPPQDGEPQHPVLHAATVAGAGPNVEFYVKRPPGAGNDLTVHDLIRPESVVLKVLRDVQVGDEIAVDYGPDYEFGHCEFERRSKAGEGPAVSRSTPHTFTGVPE